MLRVLKNWSICITSFHESTKREQVIQLIPVYIISKAWDFKSYYSKENIREIHKGNT